MVAEIWASVISSFVDQLVALKCTYKARIHMVGRHTKIRSERQGPTRMVQSSKKGHGETIEMVRMRIICTEESAEVSYRDEKGRENG